MQARWFIPGMIWDPNHFLPPSILIHDFLFCMASVSDYPKMFQDPAWLNDESYVDALSELTE